MVVSEFRYITKLFSCECWWTSLTESSVVFQGQLPSRLVFCSRIFLLLLFGNPGMAYMGFYLFLIILIFNSWGTFVMTCRCFPYYTPKLAGVFKCGFLLSSLQNDSGILLFDCFWRVCCIVFSGMPPYIWEVFEHISTVCASSSHNLFYCYAVFIFVPFYNISGYAFKFGWHFCIPSILS